MNPLLPFSAVVGLDDAKLALLLGASEPRLGGVLLRGQKGSAKTTLARGLAALLADDAPFVELPLGATEDRVLGSIDAAHLLTTGETRVRSGLLAAAHGGVLYVDEINLLADHLVDALLDTAVSGIGRIERDGISHTYPARFVLVGSMNPEEGELRPQLLDRFGLAVDIAAPVEVTERVEAVTRQLGLERLDDAADGARARFAAADAELARRLDAGLRAAAPAAVVELACRVALEVGAEGLRADLMLSRAAAAAAAWDGRDVATADDLRRVAPLVLGHRRRRNPFDAPGITPDELDEALDRASEPPDHRGDDDDEAATEDKTPGHDRGNRPRPAPMPDTVIGPGTERDAPTLPVARTEVARAAGRRSAAPDDRGRFVRAVPETDDVSPLAVTQTAVAVAAKRATDPGAQITRDDLRVAHRQGTAANLVILAVDTSSSMGADRRIAATKATVLSLLTDAYQQRDRVALITFGGRGAEIALRPTGSVEVARNRLVELPVGGTTPLADALDVIRDLAEQAGRAKDLEPIVVIVTDGRATAGGDNPLTAARAAAARLAELGAPALVIDAEDTVSRLGLAQELATTLGAKCTPLAGLEDSLDGAGSELSRSIRGLTH